MQCDHNSFTWICTTCFLIMYITKNSRNIIILSSSKHKTYKVLQWYLYRILFLWMCVVCMCVLYIFGLHYIHGIIYIYIMWKILTIKKINIKTVVYLMIKVWTHLPKIFFVIDNKHTFSERKKQKYEINPKMRLDNFHGKKIHF